MERKALTPLDFLTDNVSQTQMTQNTSPSMRSPHTKYASPSAYGPSPSELPLLEKSTSGRILLRKTQTKQETVEQIQNQVKAEIDAARFKIAAAEAQNENERIKKLLTEENMGNENLKIKLRNEISSHAQTVDQSRAVTTLAQHLRSQNEAYENELLGMRRGLSAVQNENRELREKLAKQDSRVDALARICKGLEVQLREVVVKSEGNLSQLDVAAQWRNHAYKANHNEARLNAQINKLHQNINQLQRSYPPIQGPTKPHHLLPSLDSLLPQ